MRKGFTLVITLVVLMIIAGCGGGGGGNDDNNGSPSFHTKTEELNYIRKLSSDEISGVISGQNCGHGNEIVTVYNDHIERLRQQSGKYVGMIGIDYEFQKVYSLDELKQANTYLKKYWNNGGLVTIVWAPANPWGTAKDWSDIQPKASLGNIEELITEGSSIYDGWMRSLDRIAAALADLKQAGVIVLWRPMQEMNGNWFWWGEIQ
jgi:mannan endo-1,4-beta-mannosidase